MNSKYNRAQKLIVEKKPTTSTTEISLNGENKFIEYNYRISLNEEQLEMLRLGIQVLCVEALGQPTVHFRLDQC